jgi:hypothetical protein
MHYFFYFAPFIFIFGEFCRGWQQLSYCLDDSNFKFEMTKDNILYVHRQKYEIRISQTGQDMSNVTINV